MVDSVLEYIQGMSVVRAFHGDKAANQTLNKTIEETEYQNFKLERKRIPYNVLEQIVLRIAAVAAVLLSIWLYLSGAMTLFTCLMMAVSAFLVYSELESAGEMFFMLPMIDASIDRVEQIDHAPRMDEQGTKQETKIGILHLNMSVFLMENGKLSMMSAFPYRKGLPLQSLAPPDQEKQLLPV